MLDKTSAYGANSYRGYSKTLLEKWLDYYGVDSDDQKKPKDMIFLEENVRVCLHDFEKFSGDYERVVRDYATRQAEYKKLTGSQKTIYEIWLEEQISEALDVYWASLSKVMTQYTSPGYRSYLLDGAQQMKEKMETYLQRLNQLVGCTGADEITTKDIVLFFDEATLIRRPPYTKVGLISTPFRVIESTRDKKDVKLTGMAHELGHYVYWRLGDFTNMEASQKKVKDRVRVVLQAAGHDAGEIRFASSWIEEVFADFVGAKIAGEAYVRSSEEMVIQKNRTLTTLLFNDHEHVPYCLRPLISMYVFNRDQDKGRNKDQVQLQSKDCWRKFFKESFDLDMPVMEANQNSPLAIWNFKHEEKERNIKRSPEQLSQVILDTIDVFFDETEKKNGQSLFQPHIAPVTNASELKSKAERIFKSLIHTASGSKLNMLNLLLDPMMLEAEMSWHWHNVSSVTGPSHDHSGTQQMYHAHL